MIQSQGLTDLQILNEKVRIHENKVKYLISFIRLEKISSIPEREIFCISYLSLRIISRRIQQVRK